MGQVISLRSAGLSDTPMIDEQALPGLECRSTDPSPEQKTDQTGAGRRAEPRTRTLLTGKILIGGGMMSPDCLVRDVSPGGARVRISRAIQLPSRVGLLVIKDGVLFDAVVAWRRGDEAALAFRGRHDIRGEVDPALARAHALWVEFAPR